MKNLKLNATVSLVAEQNEDEEVRYARFEIEAYSGGPIRQTWSREPIVIDLEGMELKQQLPIVMGHDYSLESILGQTSSVRVEAGKLIVEGEILASSEAAEQVKELAARGYQWQASVGADVSNHKRVDAESIKLNGQEFSGPLRVVNASSLREVSIVTLGADSETHVEIAAEETATEEFAMAEHASETPADDLEEVKVEATATAAVETVETVVDETNQELSAQFENVKRELADMKELLATRESRAPAIHANAPSIDAASVDEAALCLQAGLSNADKHYDEQTLEAAHKKSRQVSLGEVIVSAAREGGYDGSSRISSGNVGTILRAAFSAHSISNILSNVGNKFLLSGFTGVESTWGDISTTRSVNDFKSVSMYRLNGSFAFQKVGPAGSLQMAEASDESRTVNADTYGIATTITRQDLINDDLNALSAVNSRIGRGAALSMNQVIWGEFQSGNASFYQKATAGAGNAFGIASLKAATTAFRKLKDRDNNPLGVAPKLLVVPPDLELAAAELMSSSLLITGESATKPNVNVLSGRYRVVVSSDLTSASTWWLAADAADLPALEVAFLNGTQSPTIEQVSVDASLMGIMLRGYMDFGVAKAEDLSCYRMATS
jgi:hypothetical protein